MPSMPPLPLAPWPSGKAEDCKSFIPGSNPGGASHRSDLEAVRLSRAWPLSYSGRSRRRRADRSRRMRSGPANSGYWNRRFDDRGRKWFSKTHPPPRDRSEDRRRRPQLHPGGASHWSDLEAVRVSRAWPLSYSGRSRLRPGSFPAALGISAPAYWLLMRSGPPACLQLQRTLHFPAVFVASVARVGRAASKSG